MPDPDSDATVRLPASVQVNPGGPVEGVIRPPGSKSLTNRALICAAFAKGRCQLTGALQSEDTKVMIDQFILNVMTAYFIIKCDGSKNQRQFIWVSVIIGIFC